VKFALTAEAGMNDGTAFPFTWLAIALAATGTNTNLWSDWVLMDLLYRIAAGVGIGFLLGKLLAYLLFDFSEKKGILEMQDGFVATSATLLVYGLTEMAHGYGFMAVFVAAITLRNSELDHHYHTKLHEFTDQVERALVAVVLILFGGSLVMGILNNLTWQMAIFGVVFVFIIRPITGLTGLAGTKLHRKEKRAISFFGIKGIGSFFYLAFALSEVHFIRQKELWSIGAFVVLLSVLVHGLTATPVMQKVEEQFGKRIPVKPAEER
jgi:NhaP-type Na+/H+ or K+/H+ antiporter